MVPPKVVAESVTFVGLGGKNKNCTGPQLVSLEVLLIVVYICDASRSNKSSLDESLSSFRCKRNGSNG